MTPSDHGFCSNRITTMSRREMLKGVSCGFGMLAFAGIAQSVCARHATPPNPLAPKDPHFAPRAKTVIFLCMSGGPSHLDMFDYKHKLVADDGKALSTGRRRGARLMGSPFKFTPRGESGIQFSELVPNIGSHADKITMLKGMHTDIPAHAQAQCRCTPVHSSSSGPRWAPGPLRTRHRKREHSGFVTIGPNRGNGVHRSTAARSSPRSQEPHSGDERQSTRHGGEPLASQVLPVGPEKQIDLIQRLNESALRRSSPDGINGVIKYELAFRMQDTLPAVLDVGGADARTGALRARRGATARSAGSASWPGGWRVRRALHRGDRFGWDHHRNLRQSMLDSCTGIDKPIAGLLTDLEQRGMLDDTLVLYGGEFGRTPDAQNGDGRDHNAKGFTMWMAGGGVKGGFEYGATDDYGAEAVDGRVHIHDWHATILHLLGLDHEQLTYNHAGRDFRLTDVHGNVVRDILA